VLPPPPATPRTLIVKLEPRSRAFLVGGTFSRKHRITGILCCNQTGNAVHPPRHRSAVSGAPRAAGSAPAQAPSPQRAIPQTRALFLYVENSVKL
jgi:hypothetical protein